MEQTIECSVISCEDVLGGNTKHQVDIISDKNINAEYKESRVLLEHKPDSLAMVVLLSPCFREKLIKVIEDGKWKSRR